MVMPPKSWGWGAGRGGFRHSGCFPEPRSGLTVPETNVEGDCTDDEAREEQDGVTLCQRNDSMS